MPYTFEDHLIVVALAAGWERGEDPAADRVGGAEHFRQHRTTASILHRVHVPRISPANSAWKGRVIPLRRDGEVLLD
jgi:hypothetical protein